MLSRSVVTRDAEIRFPLLSSQWGWSVEAPIPTIVSHLRSNHMQAIAIGAHDNVVCLTGVSNEIYEWRFTEEGEHQAESEPKQNRALRGKRLVSISVGKGRCAAATAAGVLLEWGVDTKDPDAPDDEEFDPYRPREIRCLWQIAEVKCSSEHSVARTIDGKCLTWGTGGMGRLGQATDKDYSSPTLVEPLKDHFVTSIAIGPGNTGVTTKDLKAFVFGAGNSGQLGNNDIHPIFLPTQIAALQHVEITGLAFGNRHLIVVTKDGSVWASGDNGFGQCLLSSTPVVRATGGSVPISAIQVGDELMAADGKFVTVTSAKVGHAKKMYEIIDDDGRKIVCTTDHLVTLSCRIAPSFQWEGSNKIFVIYFKLDDEGKPYKGSQTWYYEIVTGAESTYHPGTGRNARGLYASPETLVVKSQAEAFERAKAVSCHA
jgi:hypothetical protein